MLYRMGNDELAPLLADDDLPPLIDDDEESDDEDDKEVTSTKDDYDYVFSKTPYGLNEAPTDFLRRRILQVINKSSTDDSNPHNMKAALAGPEGAQWKAALDAELKSLEDNKTFEYVKECPPGVHPVKSMYLKKKVTHASGEYKKHKVRLVARGDLQDPSTYSETYASTCQRKAVLLLLALANQQDLEIATADISTAFLHGVLDDPIYMQLPNGKLVKLLKALYGLKQAAFKFKEHLGGNLAKLGFKCLETDDSVYYLSDNDGRVVYVTSHVDDLMFISPSMENIEYVYDKLSSIYNMTFDKKATEYLGYTIVRDRVKKTLKLNQFGTVSKLLMTYPPGKSRKVPLTPYHRKVNNFTSEEEALLDEKLKTKFQAITGSLLYLAICTRADLLYAVHMLTRRMTNPRVLDLQRANKALNYLMHTANDGITFYGNDEPEIIGWADSSFNSGEGERKNCYGYCFQLGRTSGMFVCVCKRSTLIAQSSTEAELYALAEACRELLWIKSFLGELNIKIVCEKIFQDNTTTINMVQNGISERSKHIDVKFNFVKRLIKKNTAKCPHIVTAEMIADIFTKDLPDQTFGRHSVSVMGTTPHYWN